MSRKNQLVYKLSPTGGQSLGASFTTAPTLVKYLDNCAYQIDATTSDAVGAFTVQASLDYAVNETTNIVTNSGHWVTLPIGGTPALGSANDDILINLNQLPFNAIRLVYTRTSGTGTAELYIQCRQLGG